MLHCELAELGTALAISCIGPLNLTLILPTNDNSTLSKSFSLAHAFCRGAQILWSSSRMKESELRSLLALILCKLASTKISTKRLLKEGINRVAALHHTK